MPIYEYRCTRCDHEMSCLVRGPDAEPGRCERCGHRALRRLLSACNIRGAPVADPGALRYGGRDFLEHPERFGSAMRALETRTGVRLSGAQIDGAIDRLAEAKKAL
jgi:putative FmdB family regulatory protein